MRGLANPTSDYEPRGGLTDHCPTKYKPSTVFHYHLYLGTHLYFYLKYTNGFLQAKKYSICPKYTRTELSMDFSLREFTC